MTRTQLEELAERLELAILRAIAEQCPETFTALLNKANEASAAIRYLLAQEPVSHVQVRVTGSDSIHMVPVAGVYYAAPVPAVDLAEWKAEAMRLADEYAEAESNYDRYAGRHSIDKARAALAAHLDKLGGK